MFRRRLVRKLAVLFAAAAVPVAIGGPPLEDPIPERIEKEGDPVRLLTVADGLTAPNWGAAAPGHDARLLVTDQVGILWVIDLDSEVKSIFLDVRDRLVDLGIGGPGTFDERGLLGIACHPEYESNGLLHTYTSEPVSGPADFTTMPVGMMANHQSLIIEWRVPNPSDPMSTVDPTSAREILRIDQPQFNHNGGALNFDPTGMLVIALGDGGNADDVGVGHSPQGNGQDATNILGNLIRINPDPTATGGTLSANGKYRIPGTNPFVGEPGVLDEILATGMRNPYRFSFDEPTGRLYLGDVGQNDIEEVNVIISGTNCGWPYKEGSFFFHASTPTEPAHVTDDDPGVPAGLFDPLAQYDHDEGIAIVGGFVYRGEQVEDLRGRYVFGDFARTFSNDGRLLFLEKKNPPLGQTTEVSELRIADREELGMALLGFGQDAAGELYVLANATGTPFGDTGVVMRIASAEEEDDDDEDDDDEDDEDEEDEDEDEDDEDDEEEDD